MEQIAQMHEVALPFLERPARWATMANGHQIFAIVKPGSVVHLHTVVRTGSVNETEKNAGVSHFLEHLMFKGTERFPAGQFDRMLEGLGGRVNASTSKDFTQYFITLPDSADHSHYRLALELHADMLLHAAIPEEEIGPTFDPENPQVTEKRERMVVIEEIKMGRDNPWRQAVITLTEQMYPTHPYRREVIGTAEVIAGIPRKAIYGYYRSWYQPSNMVTIVTGDLDPDRVIQEVAEHFTFHGVEPVMHPGFPPEASPTAPRVERLANPLNVGYILMGFLGPASSDLRGTVALDMLSLVLGEGISSRLHQRLLEQLPDTPFFDVGSTHWTSRDSSNVLAYGITKPEAVEAAYDLLRGEVERLLSEPPAAREFDKAVTRLETQFAAQAETAAGLSVAIADSMARLNDPTGYINYLDVLRSITRDDLAHFAGMYLPVERHCAVMVSPGEVASD
ncbi:MAG: M16 family metallopeptidase [Armatimonadota bacterium]